MEINRHPPTNPPTDVPNPDQHPIRWFRRYLCERILSYPSCWCHIPESLEKIIRDSYLS